MWVCVVVILFKSKLLPTQVPLAHNEKEMNRFGAQHTKLFHLDLRYREIYESVTEKLWRTENSKKKTKKEM